MALTRDERETIVNMNDGEDTAYIYTAQRRIITRLRKNPAATLVEEGVHDGSPWARFTMPARLISFRAGVRLTEEQRQARAANLRRAVYSA
jgi:hypothetical protein